MNANQDPAVADDKKIDFKIDLNEKLGDSMLIPEIAVHSQRAICH